MTLDVRELVERFYEQLWNAWDDAGVEDVLSEDFAFRGTLGQQTSGPEGWRGYRDRVRLGAPDFHNAIIDLVATGDRAAARLRYTGTHRGTLLGLPATGRTFTYDGAAFFRCRDGRLSEAWVLGDLEALRRQLDGAS